MNNIYMIRLTMVILLMPLVVNLSFAQFDAHSVYKIIPKHSELCLDVEGAVNDNERRLIQYNYQGGDNQKFYIEPTNEGYFKIRAKHSSKCIDVKGGVESIENGVSLIQYNCHNNFNQHFDIEEVEDGFYRIRARHSNKFLTIPNSDKRVLVPVIQADWLNGDNQKFKFERPEKFPLIFDITQRLKESESGARRSRSQIYINPDGRVKCISTIICDSFLFGYTAHLSIHLKDEHGNILQTIESPGYGINPRSQRTETWGETQISPDVLDNLHKV